MSYLPPVNFRATPVRVGSPEAFTVSGGFALLAEAPADPASYGTIINIAGNVRNRVDVAPSAGQYRILTQTVTGSDLLPHLEYLPVLQFHSSDEGLAGTADYYATGTILTAQFFAMLLAFLTPLTGVANTGNLPAATMDPSERGRPGDVAFLADGSGYFSDGSSWLPFASGATPGSSFSLGQIMGMALDSGYVGPSFTVDTDLGAATVGFSPNAVWAGALAWTGDTTIAQIVGMTSDASAAEIASVSVGQTLGMSYDAILALVGAPSDYAATFGATLDGTWAAGGGTAVSDNFDRANSTGLGANWGTPTGMTSFNVSTNIATRTGANSGNYWSANTFADNQYAEAVCSGSLIYAQAPNAAPAAGSPAVRMATGAQTYYCACLYYWDDFGGSSGYQLDLFKCISGTYTRLGTWVADSLGSVSAPVRIKASGSTISVETSTALNGHDGPFTQRISVTDSSIASGRAGIVGGTNGASQYACDYWYGGDL